MNKLSLITKLYNNIQSVANVYDVSELQVQIM